jgi:hypothetical protein
MMLPSADIEGAAVGAEANPEASPPAAGTLTLVMLDGQEDVGGAVEVVADEVLGRRLEHDPAAVGTHRGVDRRGGSLFAGGDLLTHQHGIAAGPEPGLVAVDRHVVVLG